MATTVKKLNVTIDGEEYQLVGERGADGTVINSVKVTVDGGTGTPSASGSISGGVLNIALHNIKGEKGDAGSSGSGGAVNAYTKTESDGKFASISALQTLQGNYDTLLQKVTALEQGGGSPSQPDASGTPKFYVGEIVGTDEIWDTEQDDGSFTFDFTNSIKQAMARGSDSRTEYEYGDYLDTGTPFGYSVKTRQSFIVFAWEKEKSTVEINSKPDFSALGKYSLNSRTYEITSDFGNGSKTYVVWVSNDPQNTVPSLYVRTKQ